MSATTIAPQPQFLYLQEAYREAWKQFCAAVEALQSLSPDAASTAEIESARKRVRDAEALYRAKRDRLAEYLIGASRTPSRPPRFQLEQLAYRLWDEGGRRDGNAEADWYRAEALLGRSAR